MMWRATIFIGLALQVAGFSSAFAQPKATPPGTTPGIKPPDAAPLAQKPPQAVSVEEYRAKLQKAQEQLQQMEERPPRKVGPVLKSLADDYIVKRSDGQTQNASGDEFARGVDQITGNKPTRGADQPSVESTRVLTRRLRESIATRQRALDDWSKSKYSPSDAQSTINQLEDSGQIRTGPTWLEQTTFNVRNWFKERFRDFVKWLEGLFPAAKPGKMPSIDPNWVRAIFTITVLALLAAIAYLVWRAVGGKLGRKRKKDVPFAFSPEDAELLALPPDELRERAMRFASEGNFREALRHLYISLLLNLDTRGVWRYDARRTNWEHIAALRDAGKGNLVAPLADITRRFDRVRYGNAACESSDWMQFEQDVTALEASTSV